MLHRQITIRGIPILVENETAISRGREMGELIRGIGQGAADGGRTDVLAGVRVGSAQKHRFILNHLITHQPVRVVRRPDGVERTAVPQNNSRLIIGGNRHAIAKAQR